MPRLFCSLLLFLIPVPFVHSQEKWAYPAPDQVKAAFLKLLERPKVPLDAKEGPVKELPSGARLRHFTFASEKKADGTIERVPVLILTPAKTEKKAPAVIVLHGTGGSMHAMMNYLEELAKRGIIGVAIDARYHGERSGGAKGAAAYQKAILNAWQSKPGEPREYPFYYDTVWDLWRLVDFLETRPEIDSRKLGMIGFSMGGIQTYLAASVDERIGVIVPAIAAQSFRWSLENDQWQGRARTIQLVHDVAAREFGEAKVNQHVCREVWNKIVPGILDQFDCPSMLRLCAGRPLLILSGTKDANCPYGGAKIAIASAQRAYDGAKASDKLRVIVEEVGHTVTPSQREASLDWFETWLKKK